MNDNAKNKILFESIELNIIIIIKNYLVITEKIIDNKWSKRIYKKDNDSWHNIYTRIMNIILIWL